MALRMFGALPAYFGGKRRLLGSIFRSVPPVVEAPVFVDAFLGGGSVSLYAKARGYRVICNDVAERSHIVGKALIENDGTRLAADDILRLFRDTGGAGYAERELAPDVFPTKHARFLDTAVANARELSGPKRWLSLLLVVKYALRLRPMGNWGARTIVHQMESGDYEAMNQHYVKDIFARQIPLHPMRIAETMRRAINRGVFSNGQANEVHRGNVFEFLSGANGDVAYFDPPYAGTQSYEKSSRPLDEMLAGGPVEVEPNPFSVESPEKILPKLFEAARHIPLWIISYGNQRIDLGGLMDLVKRHRKDVTGEEIQYAHIAALASAASREKNRELLVIAKEN